MGISIWAYGPPRPSAVHTASVQESKPRLRSRFEVQKDYPEVWLRNQHAWGNKKSWETTGGIFPISIPRALQRGGAGFTSLWRTAYGLNLSNRHESYEAPIELFSLFYNWNIQYHKPTFSEDEWAVLSSTRDRVLFGPYPLDLTGIKLTPRIGATRVLRLVDMDLRVEHLFLSHESVEADRNMLAAALQIPGKSAEPVAEYLYRCGMCLQGPACMHDVRPGSYQSAAILSRNRSRPVRS